MKRIYTLVLIGLCISLFMMAKSKNPKWVKNAQKSIVKITTYSKQGTVLQQGTGFFISEDGELLTGWSFLEGADKTEVTDLNGKIYPIHSLIGVDEMYDVSKLKAKIDKKVNFLQLAEQPTEVNSSIYLLQYSKEMQSGNVLEISKVKNNYAYYKLNYSITNEQSNSPILNSKGEVLALAQTDAAGSSSFSYGLSAIYANSLQLKPMDVLNTTYQNIGIRFAWPKEVEQAQVLLFLLSSHESEEDYENTVNDFILTFPSVVEGYFRRARIYVSKAVNTVDQEEKTKCLSKAKEDLTTALENSTDKNEAYYRQAKLVYEYALSDTTKIEDFWTLTQASDFIKKAIELKYSKVNYQLAADIALAQGNPQEAYDAYEMICSNGEDVTAQDYYIASQIKERIPGFNIGDVLSLLDQAIAIYGDHLVSEATPYLLSRYEWRLKMQLFEEALADIKKVIELNPTNLEYIAKEASTFLFQKKYDDAIKSIDQALMLDPNYATGLRLKGYCLLVLERKKEAAVLLSKAADLGDAVAKKLLKENKL